MDKALKQELEDKWKPLVVKAITDEEFKAKLVRDPAGVMQEFGLVIPEGSKAQIGTGDAVSLMIPKDASQDILDEIKWWNMRLDMIREFGRGDDIKQADHIAMPAPEEEGED